MFEVAEQTAQLEDIRRELAPQQRGEVTAVEIRVRPRRCLPACAAWACTRRRSRGFRVCWFQGGFGFSFGNDGDDFGQMKPEKCSSKQGRDLSNGQASPVSDLCTGAETAGRALRAATSNEGATQCNSHTAAQKVAPGRGLIVPSEQLWQAVCCNRRSERRRPSQQQL